MMNSDMDEMNKNPTIYFFPRPFPLPFPAGVPLEDTLTARDVCAELALLPPLTASRVLFYIFTNISKAGTVTQWYIKS